MPEMITETGMGASGKGHERSFWIGAKLYIVIYLGVPRYVNLPKQMDWHT